MILMSWRNVRRYRLVFLLSLVLLTLLLTGALVFLTMHQMTLHALTSGPNVIDHSH